LQYTADLFFSVTQTCSLTQTVTFGQTGEEIDTGFLQDVQYDERPWLFGTYTLAQNDPVFSWGTGPMQDNTVGDTNGRFAYLNALCGPEYDGSYEDCEGERVYTMHFEIDTHYCTYTGNF